MEDFKKEVSEWLQKHLASWGLLDDVYFDYVFGIIQEETTVDEDKISGIKEFISAATVANIFIVETNETIFFKGSIIGRFHVAAEKIFD